MIAFDVIVAGALIGVTAWLLARALALPRLRMQAHLEQIETYGFSDTSEESELGAFDDQRGQMQAMMERLGQLTSRAIPTLTRLEATHLTAAGLYRLSPDALHGYRTLLAILLPAMVVVSGVSVSPLSIALLLAAPVAGWTLPAVIVRQRGRRRLEAIDRDLPQLIDVLIATIEAGMGFAGALQLMAVRFEGALGAELRLMQQEMALGVSTEQAFQNLLSRCDTPSVRAFARAIVHGQSLGVSIGAMLRNLAVDIRRRQRQGAREKVQKAPVKMLFPLAILIFPPLLIVIMYPAAYSILHVFASH